ncbi:MAG: MOSC domain-containing protein [Phycisphaerae bacterium]|nr:MOSC domain-containing protein [Phycisphaerae bacterium]
MTRPHDGSIVHALWRFPVKSMGGERVERALLTTHGLVGDRGYALREQATGKVVTAKNSADFPDLMRCRARFLRPLEAVGDLPPVEIELADGSRVRSDSGTADEALSAYFGRTVRLERAQTGAGFFDLDPLTLLTRATLARLAALQPGSAFDERRFRMNVTVDSPERGFVENDWVGRRVTIGPSARVRVTQPDSRCVMTTLAVDELPRDAEVMRAVATHNTIQAGSRGMRPCAGVYAVVERPGEVAIGDRVELDERAA